MNNNTTVIYRIDAEDKIVFINDAWERHAVLNDASDFASENILHKSLWDSITDETSRQLYQEILNTVRTNKSVVFNFRCDSPECRIFMEMNITAQENEVQFEIQTLKMEPRPPQKLLSDDAPRTDEMLHICGWCKRIDVGQENWKEVEEAVTILGVFEQEGLPQLTHGMCLDCYKTISEQIAQKKDK